MRLKTKRQRIYAGLLLSQSVLNTIQTHLTIQSEARWFDEGYQYNLGMISIRVVEFSVNTLKHTECLRLKVSLKYFSPLGLLDKSQLEIVLAEGRVTDANANATVKKLIKALPFSSHLTVNQSKLF